MDLDKALARVEHLEQQLADFRGLIAKYGDEDPARALRVIEQRIDFALGDKDTKPGLAILRGIENAIEATERPAGYGFELVLRVGQPCELRLQLDPLTGQVQAPAPEGD
jgi:hypothetical protein